MKKLLLLPVALVTLLVPFAMADDKPNAIKADASKADGQVLFAKPDPNKGSGYRSEVMAGDVKIPLVVVKGSPYEMGYHLGKLMKAEMNEFIPPAMEGIKKELGVTNEVLCEVWGRTSAYADQRVSQELAGLADGSGMPLAALQALHSVAILQPYSCSSIAAWGKATKDGHLYQTRNLDWSMRVGAHNYPMIVVYVPDQGIPHVVPSFAGIIGAHTGMNARGIALSEMGDAPAKEAPYQVHAPHFTVFFRTMLYDADSLTKTIDIFKAQPLTKKYHFVFGDGQKELGAVKIRTLSTSASKEKDVAIWKDNDPTDEFAPNVLSSCVYNDEGRGAFPTLQSQHGKLDAEAMMALAKKIPIKGGNVVIAVYDATASKMWVSYAHDKTEAYQRPFAYVDLNQYFNVAKK
ncbi:MAG TPA: C45 family autoproteolytic acyltransferase/hydrolase [Gemmatales bacterium]|nr:C45 family autoproteolytic acyltransferase/hydrolase [Gemmatales bacterium]